MRGAAGRRCGLRVCAGARPGVASAIDSSSTGMVRLRILLKIAGREAGMCVAKVSHSIELVETKNDTDPSGQRHSDELRDACDSRNSHLCFWPLSSVSFSVEPTPTAREFSAPRCPVVAIITPARTTAPPMNVDTVG